MIPTNKENNTPYITQEIVELLSGREEEGVTTSLELAKIFEDKYRIYVNISHKPFNQRFSYMVSGAYNPMNSGVLIGYNFKTYETKYGALSDALEDILKSGLV